MGDGGWEFFRSPEGVGSVDGGRVSWGGPVCDGRAEWERGGVCSVGAGFIPAR